METSPNVLAASGVPRFFEVDRVTVEDSMRPPEATDAVVRTVARSLAGMQKEAVAVSRATGRAWRLTSDEGPYLAGYDEAPFPLAFVTAGFAAWYLDDIKREAERRDAEVGNLGVTVAHRYTMEGSALRGTMTGGALPPEVTVTADGDPTQLRRLAEAAVAGSPLRSVLAGAHRSRFTLTVDGARRSLGRVEEFDGTAAPDPAGWFDGLKAAGLPPERALMERVAVAQEREGVEGGKGSSLRAEQHRTLHVEGTARVALPDLTVVDVALHQPLGSTFRFLTSERADASSHLAPDAATLISAGLAFCFLTQLGRYAAITRQPLSDYRVVQDTRFPAAEDRGVVDTHVHLDIDEDLARTFVDMGEQTCFLHALCRTPLDVEVR